MNHQFEVASGAARLACEAIGAGPAVVCLHAGVADRRVWAETAKRLARRFHVFAYDRRGYGTTAYSTEAFSNTRDLDAVVAAISAQQVVLIGNSLGGKVALDYTLDHPDQVRALVLIAPAISGAPPPAGTRSTIAGSF